jgi:tetratricopeptide (TPR) repeat protein
MRAALRRAKGEADLALADINDGLAREPGNAAGLLARAQLRQGKGDAAAAIADYDAILKIDPNNAQIYYQRGSARERLSQRDGAIDDYRLALARDQNMTDARKALARLKVDDRQNKPRVAEQDKKPETAIKTPEKTADDKTGAIKVAPLKDEKKISVAIKSDEMPTQPAPKSQDMKSDGKIVRDGREHPSAERNTAKREAERRGKQHECEARLRKEREKPCASPISTGRSSRRSPAIGGPVRLKRDATSSHMKAAGAIRALPIFGTTGVSGLRQTPRNPVANK